MAEVAIVVESHNETEHSSVGRLSKAIDAATRLAGGARDARVLLADGGGNPEVARMLAERFPGVTRVPVGADGYDAAKMAAAQASGAQVVAFLDGDCLPHDETWLDDITGPIRSGDAVATCGWSAYEGGWFARVLTVMDFGFLLPLRPGTVGCYASNNIAFDVQALLACPIPEGDMRCTCYAHAQRLLRRGTPVQLVPEARVAHEEVPLLEERLRRGWDLVTAARVDPELHEARWLRLGVRAAPLFLLKALRLDVQRVRAGGADAGLGPVGRLAAIPVMAAVRLVDLVGIVAALRGRPVPRS